jgi:Na+/H+-dicarboxylate symporter
VTLWNALSNTRAAEALLATFIALMTGLAAVYLNQPGAGMNVDPAPLDQGVAAKYAKTAAPTGLVGFVKHIIPTTFFGAFAEGEVLPVLLLAIPVGFGLSRVGAVANRSRTGSTPFRMCCSRSSAS